MKAVATVEDGIQAQIGNIEATYGKPLEVWYAIIAASGLSKHTDVAAMLKAEHGMTHGAAHSVSLLARHAEAPAPASPSTSYTRAASPGYVRSTTRSCKPSTPSAPTSRSQPGPAAPMRSSIVDQAGRAGEALNSSASGIGVAVRFRGFPVPGRGRHGGGALVSALRGSRTQSRLRLRLRPRQRATVGGQLHRPIMPWVYRSAA
jgi:hypothetical protein